MRKIFFTLTLITIPILSIFASGEKETNLGGQIDVYAEYSPIEEVTISLGEEVSFTNFLDTENGVFDATNTVLGVTYTPHPNIAIEAGYEFLYSNAEVMEHCVKLSAIPQVAKKHPLVRRNLLQSRARLVYRRDKHIRHIL